MRLILFLWSYFQIIVPPREYNWNVKSKASKGYEENFFFLFR